MLFAGVVTAGADCDRPGARRRAAKRVQRTGFWGGFVAHYLRKGLGMAGAWIVLVLALSALTVATLRWNPFACCWPVAGNEGCRTR